MKNINRFWTLRDKDGVYRPSVLMLRWAGDDEREKLVKKYCSSEGDTIVLVTFTEED